MASLVKITHDRLDDTVIRALVRGATSSSDGGVVTFEGVVRDNARGKRIRYLVYDAYPEMAERQMVSIVAELQSRWQTDHIAIVHRVGRLEIGECSVVVVVACPHRAEAFEACRYAIDTLKTTVPIWKKEVAEDGEEWVEG
jgi:molybdopterin synthase catalytic subunit